MPINKRSKKIQQLRKNIAKGKAGELEARIMLNLSGYEVKKRPAGGDFEATKRDILTRRVIDRKIVEVKTGKSKLSRRQRKDTDEVYRTKAFPHNLL